MHALNLTTHYVDTSLSFLGRYCRNWAESIALMHTIYRERREMLSLPDETLNDIGIGRAQLQHECSKKFSDIPVKRR